MRLEYKILWFEDDQEFIKRTGPEIERYLSEDLGFQPNITYKTSGNDAEQLILGDDYYDLIVTDLNLNDVKTGETIIRNIREENIFTEVLLYSSDSGAIQKIVNEAQHMLPRVSFAVGRSELPDRLKRIIWLTVRKVQDVNNMRGLVIAEAIDLETKIRTILIEHFRINGDKGKIERLKAEHAARTTKSMEALAGYDQKTISEFIDEVLSFSDLNDSLLSLTNELLATVNAKTNGAKRDDPIHEKKKTLEALRAALVAMKEDIVYLRNDMAHAQEHKDASGKSYLQSIRKDHKTITFSEADCIAMRKNIAKHLRNIEAVAAHL
ncbi:MAG: hypothetical protein KGJ89_00135 [Patescibacteria group bacterium]|nr:hypothetical protein [Patescibacteria group bacterium]MDE2014929.1 hypothetical protein [Patescibacteria group bacterium]MDE2226358.1 hypothetical protein [Patescibacteria group bacterium]